MTSAVDARPIPDRARQSRRALVAIEAPRSLKAPWLWLGMALSTWFSINAIGSTFAGGGYHGVMASFAAVAAGLFVLGVNAGGRDHTTGGTVAPEAAVEGDERAFGRLLGLWPALAVAVLFSGVVSMIQRLEGGMRIVDGPRVRSEAVFSIVEMLQPPVLFVVAATAGVALGRASAHRSIIAVAGALVFTASGLVYWVWQWTPVVWVALIQTQPIEIGLAADFSPATAPSTWMLSAPDQYQSNWGRVMVHQSMAAWHLVFLVGLAVGFAGLAIRGSRGRRAIAIGIAFVIVGIVAQVIVTPTGLRGT